MQTYWIQGYSSEKTDFPKGIEPVAIYFASEADARVAELEEENRKLRERNALLQARDDYVTACLI